jgi:uridine phosphorylase
MGTDDFYEGQGRLDGVFNPDYTDQERQEFFQKAYEKGVRNIEMECTAFAAFCLRAKIPAAVVCAVLLDRLKEDLPSATSKELGRFSEDAQDLVLRYIKEEINKG